MDARDPGDEGGGRVKYQTYPLKGNFLSLHATLGTWGEVQNAIARLQSTYLNIFVCSDEAVSCFTVVVAGKTSI